MTLVMHPETVAMPSVLELGLALNETLLECGAEAAYLEGEYVRADMFGKPRRSDEITLVVEARRLSDVKRDRIVNS